MTMNMFYDKAGDSGQSPENHRPSSMQSTPRSTQRIGAVVVGGDFNGLGIVRSLGRHGVPLCIIDDEHSISRFSRYTTHAVRVPDLRDERRTVDTVLDIGQRLGLDGWLLYSTRE